MARRWLDQKQSRGSKIVGAIIAVGVLIAVIGMCTVNRDGRTDNEVASAPSQTESTAEEPAAERVVRESSRPRTAEETLGGSVGERVEAWVAAQNFVRKELVSPSTAKFNGVAMEPYVVYLGDARYRVRASVDSQNAFGAMLRTEFEAVVRAERDERQTWILEGLEF